MTDSIDTISCAHLDWIFDFCRSRSIPLQRITGGCHYSLEHLTDQTQTIPWNTFLDLVSQTGKFFDASDLREVGRNSWKSPRLQVHASVGLIMFKPFEQVLSIYGVDGYCARHFPIETTAERISDTQIDIRMKTKQSLATSKVFYTILAGQIEDLTTAIGLPRAVVTMNLREQRAHYSVFLHKTSVPVSAFRRFGRWLTASKTVTREFAGIQERLENLTRDYQRLFSERESTLRKLKQKLGLFELAGDQSLSIIWTMTAEGDARFIGSIARQLGYKQNEVTLQQITSDLAMVALNGLVDTVIQSYPSGAERFGSFIAPSMELAARHKLGHNIRLSVQVIPDHRTGSFSAVDHHAICIGTDVTGQQNNNDALNWPSQKLQVISDLSRDAIFTLGHDEQIIDANPAAYAIFSYRDPELIGMSITDLLPQSLADSQQGIRRDHSLLPIQVVTSANNLSKANNRVCVVRDMTSSALLMKEKQSLERQVQSVQKMDSIGQLSSGIVHDFNNLLVAILGLTDLALKSATSEELSKRLGAIRATGERGKDMTQRLLNFSRPQEASFKIVDANKAIKDSLIVISGLLPDSITVDVCIHENPVYLLANHTQVEQVLVNLVVNARDAMPNGGTLQISTSTSSTPGNIKAQKQAAEQFVLEVRDTGTGMDQQTEQRIFEPLYTSKPEGRGTGLGLSIVSSIVKQHQGTISVNSKLGVGTTFHVTFPAVIPEQ
ncbi:MAG: ATP-binding protein [Candidatus Azotimanducaceae bacterium WSBS_2022_MAG_OTU7]